MNSPEVKEFIRQHSSLFWFIPEDKKEEISEDVLVEFILNYVDLEAVKGLFSLYGIKKVGDIFLNSINVSERRKSNYNELTLNFFSILFNRYALGNTHGKAE